MSVTERSCEMTDVRRFYSGGVILLTGGTGFIGKVLVEKLLRSCPQVHRIYLLVRPKKSVSVQERCQQLLDSKLFDRVRDRGVLSKVVGLECDLTRADLGLSPEDRDRIEKEVNIMFHIAASVRFDGPLYSAFKINILATYHLLQLANNINNIKSIVYMSTAYTNADRRGIDTDEKIYPLPDHLEELIDSLHKKPGYIYTLDEKYFKDLEHILVPAFRPNTYVATKTLCEALVQKQVLSSGLPLCIVRPSIVGCSVKEPEEGWVDSWSILSILIAGANTGIFRSLQGKASVIADIVPLDFVVNSSIVAATQINRSQGLKVYHFTSGRVNPVTWGNVVQSLNDISQEFPPLKHTLFYPTFFLSSSSFVCFIVYFIHMLSAVTLDLLLLLTAQKPRVVKLMRIAKRADQLSNCVSMHEFLFCSDNTQSLSSSISRKERQIFPTDVKQLNWNRYFLLNVLGIRKHLFKEATKKQDSDSAPRRSRLLLWTAVIEGCSLLLFLLMVTGLATCIFHLFHYLMK